MALTLYSYWRSSASWRVRLALEIKGLEYATRPVHLLENGGEQRTERYRKISPEMLVPSLVDGSFSLSQSQAICEYLEQAYPEPALLPPDPKQAAQVRSFCAVIACDTHPLNNLRVLQYLTNELDVDDEARTRWYRHWVEQGLQALEQRMQDRSSPFAFGDEPGLAECFLIPQLYNARRFGCPLDAFPRLLDIDARCAGRPAFVAAHPDNQNDRPQ